MDSCGVADAHQLASIFGDKETGCATRAFLNSHVSVCLDPSSDVGPDRTYIPVSGHNLIFELIVAARSVVLLDEISVRVLARKPLHVDGVSLQPQTGTPTLHLADDLEVAHQRSLANYRPLEIPHLEILLDYLPPIVRPALDANGKIVRERIDFPLQLNGASLAHLVLAPLTENQGCVDWELSAIVNCDGEHKRYLWEFKVTAETTFRTFYPDGRQDMTPVQELAPHWYVKFSNNTT